MSANLLTPVNSAQMDFDLGQQSDIVTALAAQIAVLCDYYLSVLTEPNRAAGLIVDPSPYPGQPPTTMTEADLAAYRDHFEKMQYIGTLLSQDQGSTPAATRIVLPWTRQPQPQPGMPGYPR